MATRVLFDTNVWSWIGEQNALQELKRLARTRSWEVVVAPATLLEAARNPKRAIRDRVLTAMADSRWSRLDPEVRLECAEVAEEVRRLRPDWLREVSDTARVRRFEKQWRDGVWRDATRRPDQLAAWVGATQHNGVERIETTQRYNRDAFRASGLLENPLDLYANVGADPSGDDRIEAWRVETERVYWHGLRADRSLSEQARASAVGERLTGSPHRDWLGERVDLAKMTRDEAAFQRFFHHDVDRAALARNWLRWAVRFRQHKHEVKSSNPIDEQIASYLYDCDMFLTGDRTFAGVLDHIAGFATPKFAASAVVPATGDVVEAIASAV